MKNWKLILIGCVAVGSLAFKPSKQVKKQAESFQVHSLAELEEKSSFSFSVISDNHGASPSENLQMAKMKKWIEQSNDAFVLGVGDHLEKNNNDFISFLIRNDWWRNNFYPSIADAENEFFGKGQGDWGSGAKFLKILGLNKRCNVSMSENGAEYYAQMNVEGVTIHYIVLHFPDNPYDQKIAFPETSKNYLINILNNIHKTENDIIIVSAHSMYGSWIDNLSVAQQKIVNGKCDLLLAGTTHYFERRVPEGLENSGPLMLSAGSVNKARWGCNNGFIQIHVMKKPLSLVVQYVNTDDTENKLQDSPYSYIKYINGGVYPLSFPASETTSQMVAQAY